ncbi:MAG: membrane protein insertion efficiency factor YidD [Desulfobacteraceae bacterium]|nr:MAG: membrane protein insertion efficiency factor YidD [Desulfobacteraceae bacterium]
MHFYRIKRSLDYLRYFPILLIVIYQKTIRPFLPSACRFYPSCSVYARQAFTKYGLFKGTFLTCLRLAKCHPWHPGGLDPLK